MNAVECVARAKAAGASYQRPVNAFIDDLRRATPEEVAALVADPITGDGPMEGLIAAVVSAVCRERRIDPPKWVGEVASREPFFAFPADSFEMRVRLLLESPPPFRIRNVFVPENYLSRA